MRLFAICLGLYSIRQASYIYAFYGELEVLPWPSILWVVCMMVLAIVFWFFPQTAASKLSGHRELEKEDDLRFSQHQLMDTLFIALGVYFLYGFLTDTAYWIYLIQHIEVAYPKQELPAEQSADIFATVVQGVLVFFLLFGRKFIYKMLRKVRYGG